MQCTVMGLNIHYTDEGTGAPILLLHGWGSSADAYARIRAEFKGSYRMIALDFPGFGKSDMPPAPWSIEDYAVFTIAFMKEIEIIDPILIGHSFGGRVIIKLCGTARVKPPKIILLDSAGVKPKKTFNQKFRLYSFKTIKWCLTLPVIRKHTENLLDRARNHYGSSDYKSAPEILRKSMVMAVNEDLTHHLPNISSPTLLIWGEKDTATPLSDGERMERLIPGAGLCVIKGAGHFSFVEQPYLVHRILESFLGGR